MYLCNMITDIPVRVKTRLKQVSSSSVNSVSPLLTPESDVGKCCTWCMAKMLIATICTSTCQGKLCDVTWAGSPAANLSERSAAFTKSETKQQF